MGNGSPSRNAWAEHTALLAATGSLSSSTAETFTAIAELYRLIRLGGARRVLFLVDRANLGRQAFKGFRATPPPMTAASSTSSTTW
jgi:type I site-specific restriction endonuclease